MNKIHMPDIQKLKVLMPVLHYPPVIGGLETWTENIAQRASQKAEVFVLTGKVKSQAKQEAQQRVKIQRKGLFCLKNLSYSSRLYIFTTLPLLYFASRKLIKKEKIDLAHCQGFLSGLIGYFLSKKFSLPYLITIQSREKGRGCFKKKVYQNALFCIASSRAAAEDIYGLGVKKERVVIIPNGIDSARFKGISRQESRKGLGLKNEFVVMTVARLEKVKGLEYLIEAAHILGSRFHVSGFKILIIGEGSQRRGLENLVSQLGLRDVVVFLGERPPRDIPSLLKAADCFCLPSLSEGFGIVILEAMAANIPVTGSEAPGIADLIKENETGFLFEPCSAEDLARAVYKVYQAPDYQKERIKANAQKMLTAYNWDKITEKVFALYQKAVRPKVILACGIFPPDIGGPATYASVIASELEARGVDVSVLTYANISQREILKKRRPFEVIGVSRKLPKGLRHLKYYLKLKRAARTAEVIYVQNTVSAGFWAAKAAKKLNKRLVVKVVGDPVWEKERGRGKTNEDVLSFQKKARGIIKKMRGCTVKTADIVITPSCYLKEVVQSWGVDERKIKVIYNSTPVSFNTLNESALYSVSKLSKEEAKKYICIEGDIILSIGRLSPWKGFSALIEIMRELLKANPNFKLVIVGEGEERENLEKQIYSLQLENSIKLAGKVEHIEIFKYFRAADVFVLNSQYEGLPHVVLEAMRAGAPVIASRAGGSPEVIENNVNGLLVEYNNQAQLKEAILKIFQSKELRDKFIENSKQKLTEFQYGKMVSQTLEALKLDNPALSCQDKND